MSQNDNHYGKYRGVVTENNDPLQLGRIRAHVPAVTAYDDTGWALPSTPYGGNHVGFFFIPPIGANVWIEFESGNIENPIWSGCFWSEGEAPTDTPDVKIIKTDFATINIKDVAGEGEIRIESATGLKIVIDTEGIELTNGTSKIKLTQTSVSINEDALEVR